MLVLLHGPVGIVEGGRVEPVVALHLPYLPISIRIKHYAVPISYPVLVLAPEHVAILEVLHPLPVLEPILELPSNFYPLAKYSVALPLGWPFL